mmetsp:Transcript_125922/g.317544  ORF Transcript_125922/g.317544 Transcript_125922/m.317544 type:complete len:102 (+) Transcript_125922:79-384(+)
MMYAEKALKVSRWTSIRKTQRIQTQRQSNADDGGVGAEASDGGAGADACDAGAKLEAATNAEAVKNDAAAAAAGDVAFSNSLCIKKYCSAPTVVNISGTEW